VIEKFEENVRTAAAMRGFLPSILSSRCDRNCTIGAACASHRRRKPRRSAGWPVVMVRSAWRACFLPWSGVMVWPSSPC